MFKSLFHVSFHVKLTQSFLASLRIIGGHEGILLSATFATTLTERVSASLSSMAAIDLVSKKSNRLKGQLLVSVLGFQTAKRIVMSFTHHFPLRFVNVNKSSQSQEYRDPILKVPFKINEHQSYNAASHLVGRAHMCAFRQPWTVKWNFTVCYKCLKGGGGSKALWLQEQKIHFYYSLSLKRWSISDDYYGKF